MYTRSGKYEGVTVRKYPPLELSIEKISDAYWNRKHHKYVLSKTEFLYCNHRIFYCKDYEDRYGGGVIVTEIIVEDNLVKPIHQWCYDDWESFQKYNT